MLGLRASLAGVWLAAAATVSPTAAREPDNVAAVEPGGAGVLTKCRNWLVMTSCKSYHHISLPPRIAVGDTIPVSFASHPKELQFFVARIALKGRHCAIFSEAHGNRHEIDKINVAPCYPASTGR
jgi:hypothetical protein